MDKNISIKLSMFEWVDMAGNWICYTLKINMLYWNPMGFLLRNALAKVTLLNDISRQNLPMVFHLLEDLPQKIDIYFFPHTLFPLFFQKKHQFRYFFTEYAFIAWNTSAHMSPQVATLNLKIPHSILRHRWQQHEHYGAAASRRRAAGRTAAGRHHGE